MPEYLLPDVGEGLTEAEIVTWKVSVGETIAINDIVVEIETAKSLVELPSPYAGVVGALLVPEGETVAVGTPIIRIGEDAAAPAPAPEPLDLSGMDLSNPAASGGGEGESLVGRNKAERGPQRRARKAPAAPATEAGAATQHQLQDAFVPGGAGSDDDAADADVPADEAAVPATPAATAPVDVRVLAKPPVRKLAKDLGVDLTSLRASGPHDSITRADVEAAASARANGGDSGGGDSGGRAASASERVETQHGAPGGRAASASERVETQHGDPGGRAASASERVETRHGAPARREWREPIKGVRKVMGEAMVASAFTLPHVTEWVTLDVTPAMELVARLRARRELRDVKVSPLLVLARAACLAIRRTPEINSWWDEAAQEVVFKSYVNLGIAAATPRGLVVPNVKDAESLSLVELATALNEVSATAREGRTQPAEMSGGTFTITNVGIFGVDAGTPIINPGESAILCFGAVKRQPWVVTAPDGSESIQPRDVCTLALAFDHRHIDGEKGSRFLADVAGIMADPATALLF